MGTRQLGAAILMTSTLLACSDPKEATESNFTKAAQAHLDAAFPHCLLPFAFPAESEEYDYKGINDGLRALAKIGLLSEKEETKKERVGFFRTTRKLFTYDLTNEGRKFYTPVDKKADRSGFCVGRAEVVDVTTFTEPADLFGHRVSQVTYTYRVDDLPDWTKQPEVVDAFKELGLWHRAGKEPLKAIDAFILTNKGWVHQKQMKGF
jgi:hypothetical protein